MRQRPQGTIPGVCGRDEFAQDVGERLQGAEGTQLGASPHRRGQGEPLAGFSREPRSNRSSQRRPGPEARRGHADPHPPADVRGGHSSRRRAALQPMAEGRGREPFCAVAGPAAEGERSGSGSRRRAWSGGRLSRATRQVKAGRGPRFYGAVLGRGGGGAAGAGSGGGPGRRTAAGRALPFSGGPEAAAALSPDGERPGPACGLRASRGTRVPRGL